MPVKIKNKHLRFVIPAKAGIQSVKPYLRIDFDPWIPAFAGMTD